jgi:membrane-bound serine protease (ClpP class)
LRRQPNPTAGGVPKIQPSLWRAVRVILLLVKRSLAVRAAVLAFLVAGGALVLAGGAAAAVPRVLAIRFGSDLEVNPVTQSYVNHQLDRAVAGHYAAAVILLDTPGGLSTSMRSIYQKELAVPIPVIVFVAPSGARAASAGVWIAQAADVLAMSPISNIGSSTPIDSSGQNVGGSDLHRKVINDAVASLTNLAQAHRRNSIWPALAVRQASNLTAQEALRMHVVDLVAPTLPALLDRLNGYKTKDPDRPFTLHLAGAQIDYVGPGFFTRVLNTLIDPNVITLLFLLGIVGLGFEVFHPGAVLPGALGAVAFVIALYGLTVLPPNWGGVALLALGGALLVVDLHAPTHGVLTVAGLVSFVVGSLLLFRDEPAPYHVSMVLVGSVAAVVALFWTFVVSRVVAARRRPSMTGPGQLVGEIGEARDGGLVLVRGELWQAKTRDGIPLRPGEQVEVEAVRHGGLVLDVRPVAGPAGQA